MKTTSNAYPYSFTGALTSQKSVSNLRISYVYGFNSQERVDEISGAGNHTTAEFWEYDTRSGRRWNQDPKPNPSISNYACFANNPILFSDHEGDTIRIAGTKREQWRAVAFLQTLTNDKLTVKNGLVMVKKHGGANPDKNLENGTGLVNDLITHGKTVYVFLNQDNIKNADRTPGNPSEDMSNGKGTNAVINIDLEHMTRLLTKDSKTNKSKWTLEPRESSFAHELIHALYIMKGQNIKDGTRSTYIYENDKGQKIRSTYESEELETVGLTGKRKYTENKIRKEQGFKARVKY